MTTGVLGKRMLFTLSVLAQISKQNLTGIPAGKCSFFPFQPKKDSAKKLRVELRARLLLGLVENPGKFGSLC